MCMHGVHGMRFNLFILCHDPHKHRSGATKEVVRALKSALLGDDPQLPCPALPYCVPRLPYLLNSFFLCLDLHKRRLE